MVENISSLMGLRGENMKWAEPMVNSSVNRKGGGHGPVRCGSKWSPFWCSLHVKWERNYSSLGPTGTDPPPPRHPCVPWVPPSPPVVGPCGLARSGSRSRADKTGWSSSREKWVRSGESKVFHQGCSEGCIIIIIISSSSSRMMMNRG